jgi:hypothetical protein
MVLVSGTIAMDTAKCQSQQGASPSRRALCLLPYWASRRGTRTGETLQAVAHNPAAATGTQLWEDYFSKTSRLASIHTKNVACQWTSREVCNLNAAIVIAFRPKNYCRIELLADFLRCNVASRASNSRSTTVILKT